jgi:hypothetical protein
MAHIFVFGHQLPVYSFSQKRWILGYFPELFTLINQLAIFRLARSYYVFTSIAVIDFLMIIRLLLILAHMRVETA